MTVTIKLVDYYQTKLQDRPGTGAKALAVFRSARVALQAVHAFPAGKRTQMDLVAVDPRALRRAARAARLRLGRPKRAFLIEGNDRTGALAGIMETLGEAGVNVTAVTALRGGRGRFGAILWVKPAEIARARRALGVRGR